jgi:hypothetical protein
MRTHISSPYLLRSSLFEHKPVFRPAGAVPKASRGLSVSFLPCYPNQPWFGLCDL